MKKTKVMEGIIRKYSDTQMRLLKRSFDNIKEIFWRRTGGLHCGCNRYGDGELALAQYAGEAGIPLISSMGTGNKLHPELFGY